MSCGGLGGGVSSSDDVATASDWHYRRLDADGPSVGAMKLGLSIEKAKRKMGVLFQLEIQTDKLLWALVGRESDVRAQVVEHVSAWDVSWKSWSHEKRIKKR